MRLRSPRDVETDKTLSETLGRMPPLLYRYMGVEGKRLEWLRQLLVDSRLYFASVSEFNDPFDTNLPVSFRASARELDTYWRRVARDLHPKAPMHKLKPMARKRAVRAKTARGQAELAQQLRKTLEKNGTASFATSGLNPLLWSYYGAGHRGVAIRFNMARENLAGLPGGFVPVEMKYQQDLPHVNFYEASTVGFLMEVLGTKAAAWKHEEEWRLVLPTAHGLVRIPERMIDGVVLGMKIDHATEVAVREWVRGRKHSVEVLRIVNEPGTFTLKLKSAAL